MYALEFYFNFILQILKFDEKELTTAKLFGITYSSLNQIYRGITPTV